MQLKAAEIICFMGMLGQQAVADTGFSRTGGVGLLLGLKTRYNLDIRDH